MPNLFKLPTWAGRELVHIVVETLRGRGRNSATAPTSGTLVLSKSLTLTHDAATCPGLVMRCKPIGVLHASAHEARSDTQRPYHRCLEDSHRQRELHDVRGLLREVKQELEKFFAAADELQAKTLKLLGGQGPKEARKLVRCCEKTFKKKH